MIFGINSTHQPIAAVWKLPLNTTDRQDWSTVFLEPDAHFKALRAPFDSVKLHYHTGIDLIKKTIGSPGEPVYAVAVGKVISIQDPPPKRRITIKHVLPNGEKIWSVYIHIIDEKVKTGDIVDSETVIARLMNANELAYHGWDYNHVHLEIMKKLPPYVSEFYQRKTFSCYTLEEVDKYFYDPNEYLKNHF
jgi:murein DD-endopeptidase MepM/ murein hydrolase activator NlpD